MKILTASQMREVDRLTTERYGIPSLVLMENAGSGVVREMTKRFALRGDERIAIFCGKGNNGGDGFVVARHLVMNGFRPEVYLFAQPDELKGDARINYEILLKMGVPVPVISDNDFADERLDQFIRSLSDSLVVDGLLGTGVKLPIEGFVRQVLAQIQKLNRVVAIDVPSGLECESLHQDPQQIVAPHATLTVTFTAPKPAHIFYPGAGYSADWTVIPIGTPEELLNQPQHWLNAVSEEDGKRVLAKLSRQPESHKGDFGHVLAVCGSMGKTGAACMTAVSALKSGAGLVTLAIPAPCLPIVAGQTLEIMTEPLEPTEVGGISTKAFDYGRISGLLQGKDILAVGPGLGTHAETSEFVRRLLKETLLPTVLDADGINAFAGQAKLLNGAVRTLVLTPHPGEFARLLGLPTQEVLAKRVELARQFALEHQVHLVLKGHRTVYAAPSGQVYVNLSGNAGMATGGSGDVLTGLTAGLLGQNSAGHAPLEEIIALAVFMHGLAGDLARQEVGERAMVASDLIGCLHLAFSRLESRA